MYFSLQSTTLLYIAQFYAQLCVNNIEVTVNTCTCTDVFTVITKAQSGGTYNSYSTGGQGFMVGSKQTLSALSLFTANTML